MKTRGLIMCCLALGAMFSSCKKDKTPEPEPDPAKPTPYYVRMTDAPGPYTAVFVDIQAIEVIGNGNSTLLNVNAGVYNLLDFSNGVDTLIATGSLTVDKIQQIRLILGTNNSVVTGGTTYPLSTPSAQQSGLKLQVHQELQAGVAYYVLLDFDANQSIVEEGNGNYSLKPVIRTIETALSGSIKGKLSQSGVMTTITVTSGGTSYSTVANANGDFIIKGLPVGLYTVTVNPATPFLVSTLTNINVTLGNTTSLGTIVI
jgi:hypothetical protein